MIETTELKTVEQILADAGLPEARVVLTVPQFKHYLNESKFKGFQAGMLHAAALNVRCYPNECAGVDMLKKEITKAARNLKELP
ncbi:MAG: hypothetical protein KGL39_03115 [Patescibacteria group bacterium]|nr:hypothetical protein [Patescibacteria group bacterium]